MSQKTVAVENTGQALLLLLRERGVEYFFANAGTDFAPLIDGFSRFSVEGFKVPRPIVVPHENTAVAMAHGYYLLTGRPQAVMVHVTVGTANAVNGIINAARGNAPIIFLAGRTPYTESGLKGSRDFHIHWPQESFDQASMLREYVKWDYELRNFHQLESVVDRAFEIAMSEPKGPVYLVLPREVIAEAQTQVTYMKQPRRDIGGQAYPDPESVKRAAAILAEAKRPLIITTTVGRNHEAVGSLTELAESWAIPVVTPHPTFVCLPTDHPMHGGQTPDPFLDEADAILNIDCDVPWLPQIKKPNESCKVIEMALDPSFKEFPIRSFPRDVAVRGDSTVAIPMLIEALKPYREKAGDRIAERYRTVGGFIASQRAKFKENLLAMHERIPHRSPVGGPLHRPGQRRRHRHRQGIQPGAALHRLQDSGDLFRKPAFRGARVGARRGRRHEARRSGKDGHLGGGGRMLYVRESHSEPFRVQRPGRPDLDGDHQQQLLAGGPDGQPDDVSGRLGFEHRTLPLVQPNTVAPV